MEMNDFRPESHVAQQSRRDKLRIQQNSTPSQHLEDYPHNLEQLSVHQGLNPDLVHLRNVRYGTLSYEPTVLSSEMLNFVTKNPQVLLAQKDTMVVHQVSATAQPDRPIAADAASFANLSHPLSSNFSDSAKVSGVPENCSAWKSIGSQQTCDWIANYTSESAAIESNTNPMFVGEGLSNPLKVNNTSASKLYVKPSYYGYQDVQSSLTNPSGEISGQNSQKHYGEMHFNSPTLYQNTLQEVVTSATVGTQGLEMASLAQHRGREIGRGSWTDGGNELLLLPTYGDQPNQLRLDNAPASVNRPVEGCHQWRSELGFLANKSDKEPRTVVNDHSNTQGLSLSLSPVPPSKKHLGQAGEKYDSEDVHSKIGFFNDLPHSKTLASDHLCSNSKPCIGSKVLGSPCSDVVGTPTFIHRNTGPLGPFTGYATILKSSKFFKPAQQLLDEFCSASGPKPMETCYTSDKISEELVGVSSDESVVGVKGGDSGALSSTFYSSSEIIGEAGGGSGSTESCRPEYQQKKAKLLYMQEEVCKRYKQYHQQMQMVVSSFASVAGLSAATPYISLALKTVSRHFKCLRNAILDQLRHTRKALGEELSPPTAGASSSKRDTSTSRLKFIDNGFQKHKSGGSNLGFFEPQQHIWRPQRGLPERAVAILRAWLFDHFLHPYPTDTDKHMLATQTGLSRNQVSNWFINARVRVWKPMVEEIHMLETKGLAELNSIAGKTDGRPTKEGSSKPNDNQPTNRLGTSVISNKQVECSGIGSSASTVDGLSAELWNHEKQSGVECQISTSMEGSLMGFVPYQRTGLEIGGLGAVSLTLGLRQSAESAQHQQQEHQLRQHFGGQMIHDFVG